MRLIVLVLLVILLTSVALASPCYGVREPNNCFYTTLQPVEQLKQTTTYGPAPIRPYRYVGPSSAHYNDLNNQLNEQNYQYLRKKGLVQLQVEFDRQVFHTTYEYGSKYDWTQYSRCLRNFEGKETSYGDPWA